MEREEVKEEVKEIKSLGLLEVFFLLVGQGGAAGAGLLLEHVLDFLIHVQERSLQVADITRDFYIVFLDPLDLLVELEETVQFLVLLDLDHHFVGEAHGLGGGGSLGAAARVELGVRVGELVLLQGACAFLSRVHYKWNYNKSDI